MVVCGVMGERLRFGNEQWDPEVSSIGITLGKNVPAFSALDALREALGTIQRYEVVHTDERGIALHLYDNLQGIGPSYLLRLNGEHVPPYTSDDYWIREVAVGEDVLSFTEPELQPMRMYRTEIDDLLLYATRKEDMLPESGVNSLVDHLASRLEAEVGIRSVRYGWNG